MKEVLPVTMYPGIPPYIFDQVIADLESLPASNKVLTYSQGQELRLVINSKKSALYVVSEAKKGHYLMIRNEPIVPGTHPASGEVFLSHEKKTSENPDLFVCTPEELDRWIN